MTFAEAVERFRARLAEREWPQEVRWIRERDVEWTPPPEDVVVFVTGDDDGAAEAEQTFEALRRTGGVALRALCTWGETTCATLTASQGGLELAVVEPRREARARWAFC